MKALFITVIFIIFVTGLHAQQFTIARIKYNGGGDWYTDPSALVNWLNEAHSVLGMDTAQSDVTVELTDKSFYKYPLLFISGHGNVVLSDLEVKHLREYLKNGGTLYANDDYGFDKSFRREMKKVFPELEFSELAFDHPVFHCYFDMQYFPKVHKHDGKPPQLLVLTYEGRIVVWFTHEADIMDGIVDAEIYNDKPEDRDEAMKFALNLLVYILTK